MPDSSRPLLLSDVIVFDGMRSIGARDVLIEGQTVARVAPAGTLDVAKAERIAGGAALPALVDAHVHLAFGDPAEIAAAGIGSVLDLGAPLASAFVPRPPLRVRWAGPLLTAPGGYPTRAWGSGGFGLEVAGAAEAREAVAMLAGRGAAVVKIAAQGDPVLDEPAIRAVVDAADRRGLRTVAHALDVASVRRALAGGVGALAHTPVEPLPDEVIADAARRGTVVISTVRAFGGAASTRDNLTALVAAGCRVVYGTDLGNDAIEPGVDPAELAILHAALGSWDAALHAATAAAASFAGFGDATLREGARANILVTSSLEAAALRAPRALLVDGRRVV